MAFPLSKLVRCAALAAAAHGCGEPRQLDTRVDVLAESDPGKPLRGVTLLRNGAAVGASDRAGRLRFALAGVIGESVPLQVKCPDGHRPSEPTIQVVLRPLETTRPPLYRVSCRPERRMLVVSVRAKSAVDVPVRYLDQEIARTDRDGVALGFVALPPGERAKFVLDTSAPQHRYLRPQSPVLQVNMPDRDEVVSLEQAFVLDAPKKVAPHAPELPQRF